MHFTTLALLASLASLAAAHDGNIGPPNITLARRSPSPTVVDVLDERGWEDVSFGLMLERDVTPEEARFVRRAHPETRDLLGGQQVADLHFDKRGDMYVRSTDLDYGQSMRKRCTTRGSASKVQYLAHPGEANFADSNASRPEGRRSRKAKKGKTIKTKKAVAKQSKVEKTASASHSSVKQPKQTKATKGNSLLDAAVNIGNAFAARITWYTGHDLLNPSCVSHSGWNPTDKSMIAAVTIDWPGKPACGQYLRLRPKNGDKAIIVRVVDSCGGCAAGSAHVDLTTTAFSLLYNLDIGLVNGVQVQKIDDPVKDYDSQAVATYGPKNL